MAAKRAIPSIEYLQSRLSYCPETGDFIWRPIQVHVYPHKTWNSRYAGQKAGVVRNGYIAIRLLKSSFLAHRLAWKMSHDIDPPNDIDHINGNGFDNRLCNLRLATRSENHQNRAPFRKTEPMGTKRRKTGRWEAAIRLHGRQYYLGTFPTAEEAHAAYLAAKSRLHTFQPTPRSI